MRENKAYQAIVDEIQPLAIFRFGATFPKLDKSGKTDYNNLVFNLGAVGVQRAAGQGCCDPVPGGRVGGHNPPETDEPLRRASPSRRRSRTLTPVSRSPSIWASLFSIARTGPSPV